MSAARIEKVEGDDQYQILAQLRRQIYQQAGKVADHRAYHSTLDGCGEAFLVYLGDNLVGTFSICKLGHLPQVQAQFSQSWDLPIEQLNRALYVYFLGVKKEYRSASLLKFIFGEVFKILVRSNLQDIFVLADQRLTARYRWLGLRPTTTKIKSIFPKSGWLQLLHTRQVRFGVYGLHADPLRWNWYLREPTQQLVQEGQLEMSFSMKMILAIYPAFAPIARISEKLASIALRFNDSNLTSQQR